MFYSILERASSISRINLMKSSVRQSCEDVIILLLYNETSRSAKVRK